MMSKVSCTRSFEWLLLKLPCKNSGSQVTTANKAKFGKILGNVIQCNENLQWKRVGHTAVTANGLHNLRFASKLSVIRYGKDWEVTGSSTAQGKYCSPNDNSLVPALVMVTAWCGQLYHQFLAAVYHSDCADDKMYIQLQFPKWVETRSRVNHSAASRNSMTDLLPCCDADLQ